MALISRLIAFPSILCVILQSSLVSAGTIILAHPPKHASITVHGETRFHSENGQLMKDSYQIETNLELYNSNKIMVLDQKNIHQYSVKVNEGWKDLGHVSETKSAAQLGMVESSGAGRLGNHHEVPLETGETLILHAKEDAGGRIVVDAKLESSSLLQWILTSFSRLESEIRYSLICLIALSAVALLLIGSMMDEIITLIRDGAKASMTHSKDFLSEYLNKKKGYQSLKHSEI